MLEAFVHLYLGHLFGDYVLQFGWIAVNKAKSRVVLISHVLLVYLSQIVFSLGYGYRFFHLVLVTIIGAVHYFIDYLKLNKGDNSWQWYLIDQILHLVTIFAIMPFFTDLQFFVPEGISERLMLMIFNAYFLAFLGYFAFQNAQPYKRDWPGYIIRGSFPWVRNVYYIVVLYGVEIMRNFLKKNDKVIVKKNMLIGGLALLTTILWEVLVW